MQTINGVYQSSIWKFSQHNREMAMEYDNQTNLRGHRYGIFHGDDGKYWVVSGRDIRRLREAGYEQINEK
ncbi:MULTISPECIES: hypothetical protein [Vibrio]|uniref:hypothetical protein n=1 Tax=Vibrio TaxID=662 RepID=UPI001B308987|nr:hypothetical protein [Vibrio crassostreae]